MLRTEILNIKPEFITPQLSEYVVNYLTKLYSTKATKDYYILDVSDIVINEIMITRGNSDCMVSVTYNADILSPASPDFHIGIVESKYNNKAIVIIKNRLKVIITTKVEKLEIGESVVVKIFKTNYDGENIKCIGELINGI